MIKTISLASRDEIERIIPEHTDGLITISDVDSLQKVRLSSIWIFVLFLNFDDVDVETEHGFRKSHVNAILDYFKMHEHDISTLYVQCPSGTFRARAVARFIAEKLKLSFDFDNENYNRLVYEKLKAATE